MWPGSLPLKDRSPLPPDPIATLPGINLLGPAARILQLGAVVADNDLRRAAREHQPFKFTHDAHSTQRSIDYVGLCPGRVATAKQAKE